jgi:hypothetical protein
MVCQNIFQRLYATTQTSGRYSAGAKYRRQFEYYLITTELFCDYLWYAAKRKSIAREYKEKVRAKKN